GAFNGFLCKGVDVGVFIGNRLPGPSLFGFNQTDEERHYWQTGDGDSGQRNTDLEHEHNDKDDVDDFDDEIQNAVGKGIGHGVDIVNHPHQNCSVGTVVIIGKGQILQVIEKVFPQIVHNILAHLGHNDGAQGIKADVYQNGH